MTYLSWDESGPCVLAWPCFAARFADVKPGPAAGRNAEYRQGDYRMHFIRSFRLATIALIPAAAISLGLGHAQAQSPPAAAPPAASTPATPAPAAPPAPSASPSAAPPAAAETPATPPAAAPVQT